MIYLDIKMMMVMNAVIIISSVIRLVMQLGIGGTALQNDVIAVFVLILVGYASDSITILLTHFFDENMDEIIVEGTELLARCLCHEIDHLNGIMYVDKAEGPLMDTEEAEEN